ncbi:MAG: hypothetical protein AAF789_02775 [Bacteroidota bacterium]
MERKLGGIAKEKNYKVPDDYFSDLELLILDRTVHSRKSSSLMFYLTSAFAASFALFILLVNPFQDNQELSYEQLLENISVDEISLYVAESSITLDEIIAELGEELTQIEDLNDFSSLDLEGESLEHLEDLYLEYDI